MRQDETQTSQNLDWLAEPPKSGLPSGFRLLCAAPEEPSWIALSLQLDAIGCHDSRLRWVSTSSEAMTALRNEVFDCIAIGHIPDQYPDWDAFNLLRAVRSSGCDDPILVVSSRPGDALAVVCCEENAELLVSPAIWDSRALVASLQRSLKLVDMRRENHRLSVSNHRRLIRERDEADHLLQQQHDIIRELELLTSGLTEPDESTVLFAQESLLGGPESRRERPPVAVPEEIKNFYQELLRTYVIMGSGSLGNEISRLAQILAEVGLSPRETLSLHLERVEQLVRGLGNRSTRHVMARADLLVLEVIMHIGECYQQRDR